MRKLIQDLIREITILCVELEKRRDYGSLREYTGLTAQIVAGFAGLLLGDSEEPGAAELAFAQALIHDPKLKPLDAKAKIEEELARRAGHP